MRGNSGFTLIEVLIAIAATGMISLAIYSGTSQTTKAQDIVEYSQTHYHAVQVAMDLINRDLSSAFLSRHWGPSHEVVFLGEDDGRSDRLHFAAFSHTRRYYDANESDQAEVSYFLAQDETLYDQYNLVRRHSPVLDEYQLEGGQYLVVLKHVLDFDIEYYDIANREWLKEWDSTQVDGQMNRLPTQVRIRLVVNERKGVGRLDPSDNLYERVTYGVTIGIPMRAPVTVPFFTPPLPKGVQR